MQGRTVSDLPASCLTFPSAEATGMYHSVWALQSFQTIQFDGLKYIQKAMKTSSLPHSRVCHPQRNFIPTIRTLEFSPILRSCQPLILFLSLFICLLRPFPINRITLALWCLAYFMDHVFKVYLCGCESVFFPLLQLTNKQFVVWTQHILFSHPSADGHWGCSHPLAMIRSTFRNIYYNTVLKSCFQFSWVRQGEGFSLQCQQKRIYLKLIFFSG